MPTREPPPECCRPLQRPAPRIIWLLEDFVEQQGPALGLAFGSDRVACHPDGERKRCDPDGVADGIQ